MRRTIIATTIVLSLPIAAPWQQLHAQINGGDWATDFSRHTVPLDEIVSGGPPKDGIPAIDDPKFISVKWADRWLGKREPVAVVQIGGEVKVYPLQILIWHEIVNDVVGGTPIAVTYCPLCNTTLAFDRRFEGRVLDFGTTGYLRHSDLLMYDRQTESWWQQATGEGIVGKYAGGVLTFISSPVIGWETVKAQFPSAMVLSRYTGHPSYWDYYGSSPYTEYDSPGASPMAFFDREVDNRLPAMERVVALDFGDSSRAYPFTALADKRVVNDRHGGLHFVVLWSPGTASPVDAENIAAGRDVGSSGVFERRVAGRTLTFEAVGDRDFRDRETGSTWNILGKAIGGPLKGQQLVAVPHGNHFWFAWAVFRPETEVIR
jgi:hypothetical protein